MDIPGWASSWIALATMIALKHSEQEAREFIRLLVGKNTTKKEIEGSVQILDKVLTQHFNMVQTQ